MPAKPIPPKILGVRLPFPTLCLSLYPPLMWSLQKLSSLDVVVDISEYSIQNLPALLMCLASCCNALLLFRSTRVYYPDLQDGAALRKWNPGHFNSYMFCLFPPTSIIPLVIHRFVPESSDWNQPELWLGLSIIQGFSYLLVFHLFFLRESVDAALFHEAYRTEVNHRDALDSARRRAERQVFECAGLYSNGAWTAGSRQWHAGGSTPLRQTAR